MNVFTSRIDLESCCLQSDRDFIGNTYLLSDIYYMFKLDVNLETQQVKL